MIAAVVPAAGRSVRMGQPKLLMTLGGETLIHCVVTSLRSGGVGRVVVVAPPTSEPEGPAIASEAARSGAEVVVPEIRPTEMRRSVELGLQRLETDSPPQLVLLAPGDSPGVTGELVARLVETALERPGCIVVPFHEGRRGHPLVLPWSLAVQIPTLPARVGVNALVARHGDSIVELPSASPDVLVDLDTPEDWHRWRLRQIGRHPSDNSPAL
jgi:molybdenum cofactor cytidylyltransferase